MIDPKTVYPTKFGAKDTQNPYGQIQDITISGDGTGSPWIANWIKDFVMPWQFIANLQGVVASGTPENAETSQIIDALFKSIGITKYFSQFDYLVTDNPIVIGADGNIYYCYADNGPSSSVVNPVGDVTGVWSTTPPSKAGELVILNHEPSANELVAKRILLADASYLLDSSYGQIPTRWGGKIYGGDASGFYLPDFDAKTIRFKGATSGPDSASRLDRGDGTTGNNVGTIEEDAMQRITGSTGTIIAGSWPTATPSGVISLTQSASFSRGSSGSSSAVESIDFDSTDSVSPNAAKTSDYESRMENILVWGGIYY